MAAASRRLYRAFKLPVVLAFLGLGLSSLAAPSLAVEPVISGAAGDAAGSRALKSGGARLPANQTVPASTGVDTVTLVAGQPGSTALETAAELSDLVGNERLRLLVALGHEGERNIQDILQTRGVDMGIVTTADLRRAEPVNTIKRVVYIAKLYNAELHILARPEIRHLTDLDGKAINLGEAGGSTQLVARELLRHYGIRFKELNLSQRETFRRMTAGDEIAATFVLAGKPAAVVAELRWESGLHFLDIPYEEGLSDIYYPASFGSADYPELLNKDETRKTIAVATALVAFDWPEASDRARRIDLFTDALFKQFEQFRELSLHPKWSEVNLASELPGLRRAKGAERALARNAAAKTPLHAPNPALRASSVAPTDVRSSQAGPQ